MALLFSSIFILADAADGPDRRRRWAALAEFVEGCMPEGALRSLVVDGVIGGVGAVVIFLPQILILFFFIALLEDCGYMARAAFLMDRLMAGVGLSGKSFIPLLSSFACAVPGIMATRVIENRRDRLATILIAPLMSCSARLPVYVILIGAFVPAQALSGRPRRAARAGAAGDVRGRRRRGDRRGLAAQEDAAPRRDAAVRDGAAELQDAVAAQRCVYRMAERGWAFLARAGTVIFAVTIVVWALAYYPRSRGAGGRRHRGPARRIGRTIAAALAEFDDPEHLDHLAASLHQRYSFLGRAGQWIEPVVRPLGWDWRIGCAAIASFPAREVVMGVLGVIYQLGPRCRRRRRRATRAGCGEQLRAARWDDTGEPVYNLPVALSIMVFFALCAQCAATLAVIRRETNSWRWPAFTFVYMTVLAYVGALVTYQIGIRLIG